MASSRSWVVILRPPICARKEVSPRSASLGLNGISVITMPTETMPRKKISKYFFTFSLFLMNLNMRAPDERNDPFHYRGKERKVATWMCRFKISRIASNKALSGFYDDGVRGRQSYKRARER